MEKRAALFTEKGVIPFGLEALVDRPAFIHHPPPSPLPRSCPPRTKRPTRGTWKKMRDGKRSPRRVFKDKNRLYLPPPPLSSIFHLPSIVKTATPRVPLSPSSSLLEPLSNLSMFTFLQKRPETELLYLLRHVGEEGEVECTLCVARGKSRTTIACSSSYSSLPSAVWPRCTGEEDKSQAFRVFFKRLVRSIAPIGFS